MVISGTGHRPSKLGNYKQYNSIILPNLTELAAEALDHFDATHVISGGAQGWDTAIALAALDLDLKVTIAVPFKDQDNYWGVQEKDTYNYICDHANEVVVVNSGDYAAWKMFERNKWMVDRSDLILALYNKDLKTDGTYHTMCYARKTLKKVINVWKRWEKIL